MGKLLKQKGYISIIILILLLGSGLRIFNLGKLNFWYDEALTILQAENIGRINFLKGNNPPLYTVFLHFWGKYFDSEFGIRLASAIFGIVSLFTVFLLGRILFTKKAGLIGAFLLAISPMHIYYSQEARMYSLVALLNSISVYFLIETFRKGRIRFLAGFVIFNILNIYCHYIGVLSWIAQVIFLIIYSGQLDMKAKKRWLVGNILIFVSFAPLFYYLIKTIGGIEKNLLNFNISPWGPPVSFVSLFMTFKNFTAGYNATWVTYLPLMAVFLYLFIKGALKLHPRRETILCLICLLIPISIAYFSCALKFFYIERFFIGSSLFYVLIVAGQLSQMIKRKVILILLVILVLTRFPLLNYYKNILPPDPNAHQWILRKIDHRAMTGYIYKYAREGDYVFHTCPTTIFPYIYYFDKLGRNNNLLRGRNFLLISPGASDKPVACEFGINFATTGNVHQVPVESKDRFWLVFSYWDFDRIETEYPEAFLILRWIDKNYKVVSNKAFGGATVFLYEKHS